MEDTSERGLAILEERSVVEVTAQVQKIQDLMKSVMKDGEHYGASFPGDKKKNLLKPGADKLCFTFRLEPEYSIKRDDLPGGHREYEILTTIRSMATGEAVAQGVGCCSTMESKYRWRKTYLESEAGAVPKAYWDVDRDASDGQKRRDAILVSTFGPGKYKAKKIDGAWKVLRIEGDGEKKENPDIADVYNTVLKMAKKRSYVDATITALAASDIFTQDAEDFQPEHTTRPAEDASAEYVDEGRSSLDAAAENGTLFDDRPAQKSATAKPNTTERAPTEPASFSSFVEALNTAVPSKDRASWMQKANGGKDGALLAKLIEEIRATYPQGATGSAPSGNLRIVAMEYIGSVVPEPDRATLRADLEKTSDSEIAAFFGGLRDRYER
jgi:hypothetical protein